MENKIYKEAILDAKALRASAIANAKSMMQEAIEPAIQEMMRLKLSEELEEEVEEEGTYEEGVEEEGYGHKEEGYEEEGIEEGDLEEYGDEHPISTKDALQKKEEGVEEEVTETTLEEILAELDALEEDESLNEAEEDETEEEDEEDLEADEDLDSEEAVDDDTKVVQLTLGDLKAALFPQMSGVEGTEDMGDMEAGDEEAPVSLDEILAELEAKEEGKMVHDEAEKVEEAGVLSDPNFIAGLAALLGTTVPIATNIYKNMKGKSSEEKKQIAAQMAGGVSKATGGGMEEELKMAKETIETLRESINEINLLNAKLLYMNKIFKSKNLTESQKVKVVKAFDRSASVKEVKNTYEVLKESIETRKTQLKESVGFASKPIGSVAKNNIIEADPFINRWQKIAGIK